MNGIAPLAAGDRVVIVGAGLAGLRVAITLREEGFAGAIVLLSDEAHPPYDRPPLSKAVLMEPDGERRIALSAEGELDGLGIDLRLGARCVAIDRAERHVVLADGATISFDRLVLATGSSVRQLPGLEWGMAGVHYLRTLDDALALRVAAAEAKHVAIVGAGVIGLEVAAALSAGRSVTVIDPAPRPMMRSACPAVSAHLVEAHQAAGVALRLGVSLQGAETSGQGLRLALSDTTAIEADLVIVGVGVVPNSQLASDCGLVVVDGGIVVDAQGCTDDPVIYAAGEVAWHPNAHAGRHDKQETWAHAAAHGEHVARALLGEADYDTVPSYWSDQYEVGLQVIGTPIGEHDVVRGDPASGSFLVFHVEGGVVRGISAINAVRDLRQAKKLLGARFADPAVLADPGTDIKTLAA